MKDSQIKKGIEEAIGEEKWLTDNLVRKMMQPKKSKKKKELLPILATALIASIALFLFIVEWNNEPEEQIAEENIKENTSGKFDTEQFYQAFPNDIDAKKVIQYFEAIQEKDYGKFESISSTYVVASNKEVFQKYENVNFESLRILGLVHNKSEPGASMYLIHENITDGLTYMNRIFINYPIGEQIIDVSEDIYEDWTLYKPYKLPETVALNYVNAGETGILSTNLSRELVPISQTYTLPDGGEATIYMRDDAFYLIIEKEGRIHHIPYFDYYNNKEPEYQFKEINLHPDNNPINIVLLESPIYEKKLYLYYSESEGNYQYLDYYQSNDSFNMDIDNDGQMEILFDDKEGTIFKVEDDRMMMTTILPSFREPRWAWPFLHINFEGSIFSVEYSDAIESKSSYYQFISTNELKRLD